MLKLFLKKTFIYLRGNRDDLSFGKCFHYGYYGFDKDLKLAKIYYLEAAKHGKEKEAYYYLSKLAEEEHNICDLFYYQGIRCEYFKDYQWALAHYEETNKKNAIVEWGIGRHEYLIKRNYAPAMYRAALLLKEDHLSTPEQTIKKDLAAALIWYRKAVIGGSKEALDELILLSEEQSKAALYLAQMYERGEIDNEKPLSSAVEYYKKASKLGDTIATCRLRQLESLESAKGSKIQKNPKVQNRYGISEIHNIIYKALGEHPKYDEIEGYQIFFEALGRKPTVDERLGFNIFRNELGTTPTSNEVLGFDTLHKELERIPKFDEVIGFDILYKQLGRTPTADETLGFKTRPTPSKSSLPSQEPTSSKDPKIQKKLKGPEKPMDRKEERARFKDGMPLKTSISVKIQTDPKKPKNQETSEKFEGIASKQSDKKEKLDTKHKTPAFSFYEKPMVEKNKETALHLGFQCQRHNKEKAFDYFIQATKLGHPKALISLERLGLEMNPDRQLQLSNLYRNPPFNNERKTLYWCQQAIEGSHLRELPLSDELINKLVETKQAINFQKLSQMFQPSQQGESRGLFSLFK